MLESVIAVNSIKKNIKLQLFQIDNKDKSKHSKNSVKQQMQTNIHERMSKKIECQSSFECLCQEGSKHSSRSCVTVA
jgi:23S rRNA pseudoU1915 N3-methylase RlmH